MLFTPRDAQIIDFAGRHKFVTAEQTAEYLGMSTSITYRRLRKLVDEKHLYHQILLPNLLMPTHCISPS